MLEGLVKCQSTEVEYMGDLSVAIHSSSSDGKPPFLGLLCTIPLPT